MPKHKRNNMATQNGNMETILVASGNQALATGALVTNSTAYNLASGQLGVLSWDHEGNTTLGNFLTAGDTVTDVDAIKVLQGTPNSTSTNKVNYFEVNDQDRVESGIIRRDSIRSVTAITPKVAHYSAHALVDLPTPTSNTEYLSYTSLDGVKEDRNYGDSNEAISSVVVTPDFTALGTVSGKDWLLQYMAADINTRSILLEGSREVIVLGVNTTGGAGQAIGTINCGTSFDVQNSYLKASSTPVTTMMTADTKLIAALAKVIENQATLGATDPITAASTIEVIDITTAGTAANVDALIFIGLDSNQAAYFDNVPEVTNNVSVELSQGFRVSPLFSQSIVEASEGAGEGRLWTIDSDDRYQLSVHTMQNHPFMDFFSKGVTYIDPTKIYTSYIIDYTDYEETLSYESEYPKQLIILLEGTIACTTVAAAVTELGTSGEPFVASTDDAATVAGLNASLGAWLISAKQFTNHQVLGESTSATYFV